MPLSNPNRTTPNSGARGRRRVLLRALRDDGGRGQAVVDHLAVCRVEDRCDEYIFFFDREALSGLETRARRTGREISDCNSRARLGLV